MLPEGVARGINGEPRLAGKRPDERRVVAVERRAERVERRPVGLAVDRANLNGGPAHPWSASESSAGSPS
jgi:hypothetical protein